MTQPSGRYVFKPHEQPFMPGSPASPDHAPRRRLAYLLTGLLLSLMAGFQNGFLMAFLPSLRGDLALDMQQGAWVQAIYYMTYCCMSILFFKIRKQFGVQRFVRISLVALLLSNVLQVLHHSYVVELVARAVAGISASGMLVMSMFYLMQGFMGKKKLVGLVFGIGLMQLGTPLAQAFMPALYADGLINSVFGFQLALAAICVACVVALPLPPGNTEQGSLTPLDALSFVLFAGGVALLCGFLVQGRIVWWSTTWLGWLLAGGVALVGTALCIESSRSRPMLDWHWMTLPQIIVFGIMGAMARFLTSEQTVGASGLMSTLGVSGDSMSLFWLIMSGASLLGIVASVLLLDIDDIRRPVMIALVCFAAGAWMDTGVGMQTRPAQLYFSQAIVAFAALLFMGPMLLEGIVRAMAKSPDHIMSFSAVFGLSQSLGGLTGAAGFSAFLTYRTREHLTDMAQGLTLANPAVAADIQGMATKLSSQSLDVTVLQGQSVSRLVTQATREATVAAYADLFGLLAMLAGAAALVSIALWIYRRMRRIDILAEQKASLASLFGK